MAYHTTPKMAKRKEAHRARILHAAIHLFGKLGYHATTVPRIVRQSGSSIGAFYFYFRNKEDVFAAALEVIGAQIAAALNKAIGAAGDSTLTQMRAAVQGLVIYLSQHPAEARILIVCRIFRTYFESGEHSPLDYRKSLPKRRTRSREHSPPNSWYEFESGCELLGRCNSRISLPMARSSRGEANSCGKPRYGNCTVQFASNRGIRGNFMNKLLVVLWLSATIASAQTRTCDVKESETQVREVIQRVMDLHSQQDDRFLTFYASDEYSFPGESWVFPTSAPRNVRKTPTVRVNPEQLGTWKSAIST